ncbi:MAG: response regulator [Nitrospiraceae bacterium]|nr:response regulator [Nitrospiraceae bacterium]
MQSKKKVLIVDDDELHLYTTKELLQNDFIEVITHKNWLGVTNVVRNLQPDLVLLDINMPALSGDKLATIIKPYCEAMKTPIVFHSSNDEDSLRDLAKTHGVRGYICKGNIGDLRSKVNQYLKLQA